MKTLFIDESGKSGTQRYKNGWNFADKPYFILCGLLVPDDKVDRLNTSVTSLYSQYKIQGNELKASKAAVQKHNSEIMSYLWNIQNGLGCSLLAEVVDKRYCIAMLVTDYCVLPYYDTPEDSLLKAQILKRSFANYISETVSDQLLGDFAEFFDSGVQDVQRLEELCHQLIDEGNHVFLSEYVTETIDSFTNYEKLHLKKHHVFPLLDQYNGGTSSVAVSPQINSFNNILTRSLKRSPQGLTVIHDRIPELRETLEKTFEQRVLQNSSLQFKLAKSTPGIQLADFWGGNIGEAVQSFLRGNDVSGIMKTVLQENINYVGTYSDQVRLFPYNLERCKEKYDYDRAFHSCL